MRWCQHAGCGLRCNDTKFVRTFKAPRMLEFKSAAVDDFKATFITRRGQQGHKLHIFVKLRVHDRATFGTTQDSRRCAGDAKMLNDHARCRAVGL